MVRAAESSPWRPLHARLWGLLLTASALYFFTTNDADPDLWGHVFFGRLILEQRSVPYTDTLAYTTAGLPWVDHEWLAQAVLAGVHAGAGNAGLLLLKLLLGGATAGLVVWRIRARAADPWVWGGVGLLAIAVLARGLAFRPQAFTYLATALTLAVLDCARSRNSRSLWLLPLLVAVWVNLHGGVLLGLGIIGMFAVGETIREPAAAWRAWIVLALALAATALNPYGPQLLRYVLSELGREHPITEWQPPEVADAGQFAFFAMLALFAATVPFARHWRARGWEVALSVIAAYLALRHQRHTPVFALCAAAPLAAQAQRALLWSGIGIGRLGATAQRLLAIALGTLAAMQIGLTGLRFHRDGLQIVYEPGEYPAAAVRVLASSGASFNLAVPLEWGEYALWFLAPHVKVSLDGRFATVFPPEVVEHNFDFFAGVPGWRRLIDDYPTDAALVPLDAACPIAALPGWDLLYEGPVARVYARRDGPAWAPLRRAVGDDPGGVDPGVFP
jgi:hypothetical protein